MEEKRNEVVEKEENAVANKGPYITQILQSFKQEFEAVNVGIDLDFVHLGDWLVINSKGQFVEKQDESVNLGESIDVVFGSGEKIWSLWGAEDSPEEGKLIVGERKKEDAEAFLLNWLEENPEAMSRYSLDDLELRYIAYIVPVDSLGEKFPQVYVTSFPKTDTLAWGQYARKVFFGKYKNVGVPANTGVNQVITRISTKERSNDRQKWIGREFEPVGLFKPKDFGIKQ